MNLKADPLGRTDRALCARSCALCAGERARGDSASASARMLRRGRMQDLFKSWTAGRLLVLEELEARYCFSAATAESVVLIDRTLPNDSLLTRAIVPGGKTILYDGSHESAAEVLARTTKWAEDAGIKISSISLLSHASAGRFELGNQWISNRTLDATAQAWEA